PLIGESVQSYRVEERLGEGGMGIVYRARHPQSEARVALKVLKSEYAQNPDILARFQQEALAVNKIHHQNIVHILDLGVLPRGSPFILMEYLEGQDLATLLRERGPLPWAQAVEIAQKVSDALAAVHDAGIVHRDLKPDNIFLAEGGQAVKVLDFGIAK